MATQMKSSHDIEEYRKHEYRKAPVHILDSINRYVEHGIEPGGFVTAVLSNDLAATLQAADTKSLRGLPDILQYIFWEIPSVCWGSKAKVKAWIGDKNKT